MTNDEAIEELREASDSEVRYGDTEHHYDEVMKRVEAFDMAIKALEAQPCEDCISRQAAIDEIEYELEMINSALDSITLDFNARERLRQRRGEAREILNSIQSLPSVTPKAESEE